MRLQLTLAALSVAALTHTPARAQTPGPKKPVAEHVVMIGIDGLASNCMGDADMPVMRSLMRDGCYTLKKRSVLSSSSAINWASIYCGAPTEMHGYTKYNSKTPEIPSPVANKNGHYPTIFSLMEEQRPGARTVCIYDWDGICPLIDSAAVTRHAQVADQRLAEEAAREIKQNKPVFLSVVYNMVDHAGHSHGWGSKDYMASIKQVDTYIGQIIQALRDAGLYEKTAIVVTSDHGGTSTGGHGGITLQELETPFIVCGQGVRRGGEFTELMMQYDCAATMAYMLGLSTPQCWFGRPMLQTLSAPSGKGKK